MAKVLKLKNKNYLDSSSIVYKKSILEKVLDSIKNEIEAEGESNGIHYIKYISGEINWMEKADIIKLQETEDRSKSNTKRLDEHDNKFKEMSEKLEDIHELTYSIKEIATEVKLMREDVNKLDTRVGNIENEPAKDYKEVKKAIRDKIILSVVGAIVGAVIALIIK